MKPEKLISVDLLMADPVWKSGGDPFDPYYMGYQDALDNVEVTIEHLPSWNAWKPVHGRWIRTMRFDDESPVRCSECLMDFSYIDGMCYLVLDARLPHYCPNCGSKNKVEE